MLRDECMSNNPFVAHLRIWVLTVKYVSGCIFAHYESGVR